MVTEQADDGVREEVLHQTGDKPAIYGNCSFHVVDGLKNAR